jgi:hypothetical protein
MKPTNLRNRVAFSSTPPTALLTSFLIILTNISPLTRRVKYSPYKRIRVILKKNLGFIAHWITFKEGVSPNFMSGICHNPTLMVATIGL